MKFPSTSSQGNSGTIQGPPSTTHASTTYSANEMVTPAVVTNTNVHKPILVGNGPIMSSTPLVAGPVVTTGARTAASNFFRRFNAQEGGIAKQAVDPNETPTDWRPINEVIETDSVRQLPDISETGGASAFELKNFSTNKNECSKTPKPGKSRKNFRAPLPPQASSGLTNNSSVKRGHPVERPCQTHSFHTDANEVKHMEEGLLKLLDDFNSGKLRAFGQGCSMEQMEKIRDQQESLAKLHFDIGGKQDLFAPLSDKGLEAANGNMDQLMNRLEKLSMSIGELNPSVSIPSTPSGGQMCITQPKGYK